MKYVIWILIVLNYVSLQAQKPSKSLKATYITSAIEIDGLLEEAVWQTAETGADFVQYFPTDTENAVYPTSFQILYDETTLYVGIKAQAPDKNYIVSSLRRDFRGDTNDSVNLLIDSFNDGTNAYFFGVTPYGVRREGLISEGGEEFDRTWDVKWHAESSIHEDYYLVEMAIPFSSLKFIEGTGNWRMRVYRWNIQSNEKTTWTQVPRNHDLVSLAYMGELIFEKPLEKSRTPLAIIPYLNTAASKDYDTDNTDTKLTIGGDAKVAIGNAMNLDITLNPDFSNVEVDKIFTNLTRFDLRLPEKRQFFIDNNDLFANFGSDSDNQPFFSRRVGLARNTEGDLIENRILGGARLSGKLTPTWRLGFLNLQTDEDPENEISSYNNMMLSFQKKVFTRSNLGFFMVNKQSFQDKEYLNSEDRYNRVVGIDYDLASADNVWNGNFFVHKSFQPDDGNGNFSGQSKLSFDNRNWRVAADFVYVDEAYRADLGFVPRKDIFKTAQSISRRYYPKDKPISNHSFTAEAENFWRPSLSYKHTDHIYSLGWSANFKNQARLRTEIQNNFIHLIEAFDPTRTADATPLPENSEYSFNQIYGYFNSNPSKLFTYSFETCMGEFYNGESYSFEGEVGLRFQPKANISLGLTYDGIRLPEPYADADLWLATATSEITFSKKLFWSTLIQYSKQRDNLGINSRLQWRFAPLSDLFLVYNDNYYTGPYSAKFRSINLKLTYWLNL